MNDIRYITTDLDKQIDKYLDNKITDINIKKNHDIIRKELNIDLTKFKLTSIIVKKLFLIFDKIYFKNLIQSKLHFLNIDLDFDVSNKCKNAAGLCKYRNYKMEIIFSKHIIEKIYNDKFEKIEINGLICFDIVDVLINLMEHEITHLILNIYDHYKNDIKSGHNSQFKNIVYNMYRHTKITHDLLSGDLDKYEKIKENINKELKIGMKIQCKKNEGTVINITPKFIAYKTANSIKGCRFNEYKIIDTNYKLYQDYISNLKKKLKIGVIVKWNKYSGPITKITDDRVYFRDEKTLYKVWCLIDLVELD